MQKDIVMLRCNETMYSDDVIGKLLGRSTVTKAGRPGRGARLSYKRLVNKG